MALHLSRCTRLQHSAALPCSDTTRLRHERDSVSRPRAGPLVKGCCRAARVRRVSIQAVGMARMTGRRPPEELDILTALTPRPRPLGESLEDHRVDRVPHGRTTFLLPHGLRRHVLRSSHTE